MREYRYVVDREGRIFHDGTEIVDARTLGFFLRAMTRTGDGQWLVVCQGERNLFEPHDTPFVVQRLGCSHDAGAAAIELRFAGGYREPLVPVTLESEAGQLYCRVRGGRFRARLGRIAMQQLAPFLVDEAGGIALAVGDARYPIRELTPAGG